VSSAVWLCSADTVALCCTICAQCSVTVLSWYSGFVLHNLCPVQCDCAQLIQWLCAAQFVSSAVWLCSADTVALCCTICVQCSMTVLSWYSGFVLHNLCPVQCDCAQLIQWLCVAQFVSSAVWLCSADTVALCCTICVQCSVTVLSWCTISVPHALYVTWRQCFINFKSELGMFALDRLLQFINPILHVDRKVRPHEYRNT